jgi:hypothetical protein
MNSTPSLIIVILLLGMIVSEKLCSIVIGAFVLLWIFALSYEEPFTFSITPWKKTCLETCSDEKCCALGRHGFRLQPFEYTSDFQKFKCSSC